MNGVNTRGSAIASESGDRVKELEEKAACYGARVGGEALLSFVALLFVFSWLRLLLAASFETTSNVSIACAFLVSAILQQVSLPKNLGWLQRGLVFLFFALLLTASLILSSALLDTSYDGQMYHQAAVLELALGWNPLYSAEISANQLGLGMERIAFLIRHYPKGLWIAASAVVETTGDVKSGKAVHLLVFFGMSLLAYAELRLRFEEGFKKGRTLFPLVFALLLLLNPIISSQFFTYYHDGVIGALLVALFFLYLRILRTDSGISRFLALISAVLLFNIKFTATVYLLLFFLFATVYLFLVKHSKAKKVLDLVLATSVLGLLVFGYNPYVSNFKEFGTPFYPVSSYPLSGITPANETLIKDQLPGDFVSANRFEKLASSLFAQSENVFRPKQSTAKLPFSVSAEEWRSFENPDVRLGGFGPLFALSLLLSLLFGVFLLKAQTQSILPGVLFCSLLLFSTLINPEAWWARYVPQLWCFPLVVIFLGLKHAPRPYFGGLLLLLLLVNGLGVAGVSIEKQVSRSGELTEQLETLSEEKLLINFSDFRSNRLWLQQFSVEFLEVEELTCENPHSLLYSKTRYCRAGEKP